MKTRNKFDKESVMEILKFSVIVCGAGFAIMVLQGLSTLDFGQITPAVVAILAIAIDTIKEFKEGQKAE